MSAETADTLGNFPVAATQPAEDESVFGRSRGDALFSFAHASDVQHKRTARGAPIVIILHPKPVRRIGLAFAEGSD